MQWIYLGVTHILVAIYGLMLEEGYIQYADSSLVEINLKNIYLDHYCKMHQT